MTAKFYLRDFLRTICVIMLIFMLTGCSHNKEISLNYYFPGNQWERFNILSFEIPVEKADRTFDIFLSAGFLKDYQYETLDFNMVLQTSAGEERINEYQLKVKSKGGKFLGIPDGDTVRTTMMLKRGLKIGKAGILKIDLENLVPRMSTQGITGLVISLVPSGE